MPKSGLSTIDRPARLRYRLSCNLALGVIMVYTGGDAGGSARSALAIPSVPSQSTVNVPGLVAAAAWAVALAGGLVALIAGHDMVAAVVLVLGVMAPWFGVAWVSRSGRPAPADDAVSLPTGLHGLGFTAR
jgi:hypothetical protein